MKRRVTLMFGSLVVLGLVTGGRSEAAMGQLVTQVTVGGPFLANVTAVSGDGSRLAGDGVIVDVDTGSATYVFGSTVLALDGTGQKALLRDNSVGGYGRSM